MSQVAINLPEFSHAPIDTHSHFNHGSKYDCPDDVIHARSYEFVEAAYRNANVTQVGISTFGSMQEKGKGIVEENEFLHKFIDEKEWVYQWVVVHPQQPETYKQAERMLSHPKALGIKIHPDCHGYNILDFADDLFAFADAHKTFLLMHPQQIPHMAKFANKYPNMKLIIAHLGSKDHVDAIADAVHGNIYTDTSGILSARNSGIEYAVQRVGSEKLLFGTDTYSFVFQFGRIALSNLPMEDKENILFKNAMRLFPRAFGE